jgi:uncharacterized protein YdaT
MPWTMMNYPTSMKNLPPDVRKKAIEIANALREQGYEEGHAIDIATETAERWAKIHQHPVRHN